MTDAKPERIEIFIDNNRHAVEPGDVTGLEIRRRPFPWVSADRDIWLEHPGSMDTPVADGDVVHLIDGLRFYTVEREINNG